MALCGLVASHSLIEQRTRMSLDGISHPLRWLENPAGPLVLMPVGLLPEWSGIDVPPYREVDAVFRWNVEEPAACDYDRACDVADYVGVIPVGFGEALVLGDVPSPTAWIPQEPGGVLVRWEYAENEGSMERAIHRLSSSLAWEHKGRINIVGSPLELFNAAEPGVEPVMPRISVSLEPGIYDIAWTRYAPNDLTAATLIALRKVAT